DHIHQEVVPAVVQADHLRAGFVLLLPGRVDTPGSKPAAPSDQREQTTTGGTAAALPQKRIFRAALDVGVAGARIPPRLQAVELLFADVPQLRLELLDLLEDLAQLVGL